ncbi:MAG TPA: hypoxanthine phosphoribosyltransferase, partial [Thermoanaerobaculia bacterium]|nr:hypoxanthine phosphoribosyltransferase [Thermoanaerobaculia bacterium]
MALQTLIDTPLIDQRIQELARRIAADFEGKDLIALCVLKGAVFFLTDLVRRMPMDVAIDFL